MIRTTTQIQGLTKGGVGTREAGGGGGGGGGGCSLPKIFFCPTEKGVNRTKVNEVWRAHSFHSKSKQSGR